MTQQDYEQKKCECWEEFKREVQCLPVSRHDVFCAAFDRAYALGKQEKDAEGEDKLLGVSRKQIDALQGEIFDAIMDAHDDDDWQAAAHYILDVMPRSFAALFGSKCLPDNVDSLDSNVDSSEPKPAEPKEREENAQERATLTDDCQSQCKSHHIVDANDMIDDIIKNSFREHNRLHIAAQIVAALYANHKAAKGFKSIEELVRKALDIADALIKESEKGGSK